MSVSSASSSAARLATVVEFLPALARRHLVARIPVRASLHVHEGAEGVYTLVLRGREGAEGEVPERRVAQFRAEGGHYRLFWKNGSGRWTAYASPTCSPFEGSLDDCLAEVARDSFGCFWS